MYVPGEEHPSLVARIAHLRLHDLHGIVLHVKLNDKLTRFIRLLHQENVLLFV